MVPMLLDILPYWALTSVLAGLVMALTSVLAGLVIGPCMRSTDGSDCIDA